MAASCLVGHDVKDSSGGPALNLSLAGCLLGTTPETLHLPAGVDDALRPGEEGVTDGADLGLKFRLSGACGESVATQAGHHSAGVVGGVKLSFHGDSPVRSGANQPNIADSYQLLLSKKNRSV